MTTTINSYSGVKATDRGTLIQSAGQEMDKNAFLTILAAELSNLDPTGNNDSTQYVTQMAQFAQMEQTANLNATMESFANNSIVGKGVTLNVLDAKGHKYTGIVRAVTSKSSGATISVEVNENGENVYKDFDIKDISTVLDVDDYTYSNMVSINSNTQFLTASSFIDKYIKVKVQNEEGKETYLTGQVLGVSRNGTDVRLRVKLTDTDEIKEYSYSQITKAANSIDELADLK